MKENSGQLLIEILLTVSIAAIVLALGGNLIYVSLRSNQLSSNTDTLQGLAQEEMSGVISSATQQWQNVFNLTKNTQNYYVTGTSTWAIATGTETKVLNGTNFTRYFKVQNVCRSASTGNMTGLTDSDVASATFTSAPSMYSL